jgi:hypothetical protein
MKKSIIMQTQVNYAHMSKIKMHDKYAKLQWFKNETIEDEMKWTNNAQTFIHSLLCKFEFWTSFIKFSNTSKYYKNEQSKYYSIFNCTKEKMSKKTKNWNNKWNILN